MLGERAPGLTANVRRLNTKLQEGDYPPMSSLVKDLSDGVRLIQLMVRLVIDFFQLMRLLKHVVAL